MMVTGDYITVKVDCIIMKTTLLSDFVKKGSKLKGTECKGNLNVRNILLYVNSEIELLNFQEKIGTIAGKNRKNKIIDYKVDQFYGLFVVC